MTKQILYAISKYGEISHGGKCFLSSMYFLKLKFGFVDIIPALTK